MTVCNLGAGRGVFNRKIMTEIKTKRAYDEADADDGFRILVDRLWPRGVARERLACPLWAKDIAPSDELRKWFHADPAERWPEFRTRYEAELAANPAFPDFLKTVTAHPVVTLVYASRDRAHNEATVLQTLCTSRLSSK